MSEHTQAGPEMTHEEHREYLLDHLNRSERVVFEGVREGSKFVDYIMTDELRRFLEASGPNAQEGEDQTC